MIRVISLFVCLFLLSSTVKYFVERNEPVFNTAMSAEGMHFAINTDGPAQINVDEPEVHVVGHIGSMCDVTIEKKHLTIKDRMSVYYAESECRKHLF